MHAQRFRIDGWRARGGAAAVVLILLLGAGAWWHEPAAALEPPAGMAGPGAAPAATVAPTSARRDSYADVVDVVAPAVVTIRVRAQATAAPVQFRGDEMLRRFFGEEFDMPRPMPPQERVGIGSGVVVSEDGYILTNHHVIDGAQDIAIEFVDGRTLDATLVGADPPSDLAVLKVEATGLRALRLGDSDAVRVGDVVLAVGNPLGIGQTVTQGIISAKGRATGFGTGTYEDFLQTDAPINRGNSGGALVSASGDLIGINSQILSPSGGNIGIGFAIPATMARHVMEELRSEGRVRRAQLGVTVQTVTSDLAESLGLPQVSGAIVSAVERGSAASRAGLLRNDVILSFNGQAIGDSNTLRNRVAASKPGSSAELIVVRDGREVTLTATLDEAGATRAADDGEGSLGDDRAALGMSVTPVTPEVAARAGLRRGIEGLLVQEVTPDSRAARAGLQRGDVIQEVNRHPVRTVEALRTAIDEAGSRPVLILVTREGRDLFLTVRR